MVKMADGSTDPVREVDIEDFEYDVIPFLKTPSVDPGGQIRVGVYITGYGEIPRTKLNVFNDHPEIIDSSDPGRVDYAVGGDIDVEENIIKGVSGGEELSSAEMSKAGMTIGPAPVNFADDKYWGPDDKERREDFLPRIMAEGTYENAAPIEFTFNTTEDATPGDYEFHIALTTTDGETIQQSKSSFQPHINTVRERWEPVPTAAGILAVLIALFSLLHQTGIFGYLL
jgi:hypothetical protein